MFKAVLVFLFLTFSLNSALASAGAFAAPADELAPLRQQAEKGDAPSQADLGWRYHEGIGVAADDAAALGWLHKAARQGDAEAEYHLGQLYENGQGTALDFTRAQKWFLKAADQGNLPAQIALGDMYAEGWGNPRDEVEACFWYGLASKAGAAVAAARRDALEKHLGPAELPALRKRIEHWRPVKAPSMVEKKHGGHHSWGRGLKAATGGRQAG